MSNLRNLQHHSFCSYIGFKTFFSKKKKTGRTYITCLNKNIKHFCSAPYYIAPSSTIPFPFASGQNGLADIYRVVYGH